MWKTFLTPFHSKNRNNNPPSHPTILKTYEHLSSKEDKKIGSRKKAALMAQLRCGHCKELAAYQHRNDDNKDEKACTVLQIRNSPNQVLTHAARAAAPAKQLNFRHLWWPRAARAKGSGQSKIRKKGSNSRYHSHKRIVPSTARRGIYFQ